MSDPILFAVKDPALVLSEALETYRVATITTAKPDGVRLAPADPRRLLLQTFVLLLTQQRALIDYSGKQNLIRYVDKNMPIATADYIKALAEAYSEEPIPAKASECTQRFTAPNFFDPVTVPAEKRVTDGTNIWFVVAAASGTGYVDATVRCTIPGASTNGIVAGQIATLVDDIPGVASTSNVTTTISGRDIETTEAFRERLRSIPESDSTCGPRLAYEARAREASSNVADAKAFGPDDVAEMVFSTAPNPGEVHVCIIEGERDSEGELISVVPDPSGGLIDAVEAALSAEDVRPLTDFVTVKAPEFVDYDIAVTYYIARSRTASATAIQAAVEEAFEAFKIWQTTIGRDINPSELTARLVVAGAKRVFITDPAFQSLLRNQCSRLGYNTLTYGGIEDD